MKALITGIAGFVGNYLTEELIKHGIDVYGTILDHEVYHGNAKGVFTMNLLNYDEIESVMTELQPDYIFHLAGQSSVGLSWKKPQLTIETNVVGTINLLEVVRLTCKDTRILIVGSSDEYGVIRVEDCPINEMLPLHPQNPYATSKKAQEEIALQYCKSYGMDIVLVRAFNHIGPGQLKGFVVADFASQIAEIENGFVPPVIKVGNLDAKRDFSDVRDVVSAYYLIMDKGLKGEIYNVGSGEAIAVKNILQMLLSFSECNILVEDDINRFRPSDIPLIECDSSKLVAATGWTKNKRLEKTLLDILNYWRNKYVQKN